MSRRLFTIEEVAAAGFEDGRNANISEEAIERVCAILAPIADQVFSRIDAEETVGTVPFVDGRMDISDDESASGRAA